MIKQPARAIVQEMYSDPDRFTIVYRYHLGSMFRVYVDYIYDESTGLALNFDEDGECTPKIGLRNKDYRYIKKHALKIEKSRRKRIEKEWRQMEKESREKDRKYWCERYGVDSE